MKALVRYLEEAQGTQVLLIRHADPSRLFVVYPCTFSLLLYCPLPIA